MANEKIWYTVEDFQGKPCRVPAENIHAFLARQEELKAMVERGEDPMKAEAEVDPEFEAALTDFLDDLYGKK